MPNETEDNVLHHYTSGAALLNILTTGELWFSDPRFLNDSQEWKWAGKLIGRTIQTIGAENRPRFIEKDCPAPTFESFINQLVEHFADLQKQKTAPGVGIMQGHPF